MTTEREMLDLLNKRYGKHNDNGMRYTRAEHVKSGVGFDARRVCDYMAMDLWGGYGINGGVKLHGHEVKTSRSDWLTELRDPEKAEAFVPYCDFWWLVVADKNIVKEGELPEGWGLMVLRGTKSLRAVVQPTRRARLPMPWNMQGAWSRSVAKTALRLAEHDGAYKATRQSMKLGALSSAEYIPPLWH